MAQETERPELMYTEHQHDPDIFKDVGGCGWVLFADNRMYLFSAENYKTVKFIYDKKVKEYENDKGISSIFEE